MIDPYGRILAEIGLGEKGVLDVDLPKVGPTTPFVQFGIVLEITVLLLAFAGCSPAACNLLGRTINATGTKMSRGSSVLDGGKPHPYERPGNGGNHFIKFLGEFIFRTT